MLLTPLPCHNCHTYSAPLLPRAWRTLWTAPRPTRCLQASSYHYHSQITPHCFHWLNIPEQIHFEILSLTSNSLECYRSSLTVHHPVNAALYPILLLSCLTLHRPPVTTIQASLIHHCTTSLEWSVALTPHFSLPLPSLKFTHHHIPPPSLSAWYKNAHNQWTSNIKKSPTLFFLAMDE